MSHCKTTQKRQQKNRSRSRRQRQRGRYSRKNQRGGDSLILSPAYYSNQNNSHFSGIGFTDPDGAVTGCTGSTSGVAALKGADIFTTIGGIKIPISSMNGGRGRKRLLNKDMKPFHKSMDKAMKKLHKSMRHGHGRCMQRGGFHNTNGYSIGGVHLKPSLSGIANNYHTPYDSCKG